MDSFCYVCYEEETKCEKFIKPNICKCKNLRIHKKCFMSLQSHTLCSVCKIFYDNIRVKVNNKIIVIYNFGYCEKYNVNKKDKITGLYRSYYPNGQLYIHCFYKNGKKHGYTQIFYPNGNLKEFCFYNQDLMNRKCYKYYDNDIMKECFECKDGLLQGTYIQKYRNGNIKYIIKFKNNNISTLSHFYPNGTLCLRCNYKDGLLHGRYKKVNIDYTLICDNVYNNGEFVKTYKENQSKDFLFHIPYLLLLVLLLSQMV
jgi:antitoxin component YwqK of YwqJK toxin-antitoxin module